MKKHNWKFGDIAVWNGVVCVVLSVNENQTSAWVAFENQAIDQVAVSDLLYGYRPDQFDGWKFRSKYGNFMNIGGATVWASKEEAIKAMKKAFRLSYAELEEELKDYDLVHYQFEYRNYPKFYYPETE